MSNESQSLFSGLADRPLTAVTFVLDYVQLEFDGPRLTAFTAPLVYDGTGWLKYKEPGYCDALCGCIGKNVHRALVIQDAKTRKDVELYLEFYEGTIISVSTSYDDFVPGQAEAAMLETDEGWEVWN